MIFKKVHKNEKQKTKQKTLKTLKKLTQIFLKLQIFTYILPVGFIFLIFTFFNSKYYSVKSVFVMTFFNACAIILGIIGLLLYLLEKYIV